MGDKVKVAQNKNPLGFSSYADADGNAIIRKITTNENGTQTLWFKKDKMPNPIDGWLSLNFELTISDAQVQQTATELAKLIENFK